MKRVVKSIRAGVKRAAVRFAEVVTATPIRRADGDGDRLAYEVTMSRAVAKALVAHYADDPAVASVTDALRQAARDVTRRAPTDTGTPIGRERVPTRMPADVTIDPEALTVTASRTLRPSGNSTVLTVPREVMEAVGAEAGDDLRLVAHMDTGVIEVSKIGTEGPEG